MHLKTFLGCFLLNPVLNFSFLLLATKKHSLAESFILAESQQNSNKIGDYE